MINISVHIFVVLFLACLTRPSCGQNNGNDPKQFWTYLVSSPRLTFEGTFKADVSTVNNELPNFDTENFAEKHTDGSWNPRGTGEWGVEAEVTGVCYTHDECEFEHNQDEIIGANLNNGGKKTSGKLVDLDPQAQVASQIWGWRIKIEKYLSATFTPAPFQYMWKKMTSAVRFDDGLGAVFQSTLTDITWLGDETKSRFYEELRSAMKDAAIKSDTLSIRLNIDMYNTDSSKDNFTHGRIVGSIGLIGIKSPPFFNYGRFLRTNSPYYQDSPFMVDKINKKLLIDFGNGISINKYGRSKSSPELYVGIVADENCRVGSCCQGGSKYAWLGKVNNDVNDWYRVTAGVQSFPAPGSLTEKTFKLISDHSVVVAQVSGTWPEIFCSQIVLEESRNGLEIHPYSEWVFRKNDNEKADIQLLVTKFGEPSRGTKVSISSYDCDILFGDEPKINVPKIHYPSNEKTNEEGKASFVITAKHPRNHPRKHIDGQLYVFVYYIDDHDHPNFKALCNSHDATVLLNHLIFILMWDKYVQADPKIVTWLDDVHPVLLQYSQLYPIMKEFVDLGNYYDVVKNKDSIIMAMDLPVTHPHYMPVTRDLSSSKKNVILTWLKSKDHPVGNFTTIYNITNLKRDLQTAISIEHATIPTYLTALATIKGNNNPKVQMIIRQIVLQEMLHMSLAANILNAVGGEPTIYSDHFLPKYPTSLPGGVQPDLIVPIEKLSIKLIRNVFMQIEKPEVTLEKDLQKLFDFFEKHATTTCKPKTRSVFIEEAPCAFKSNWLSPGNSGVDEEASECIKRIIKSDNKLNHFSRDHQRFSANEQCDITSKRYPSDFRHHPNTIGAFYIHILNTLGYLTECGKNNSIFTGKPERQVTFKNYGFDVPKVHDFLSAVEAIKLIVEQGEGSSPCNPIYWDHGSTKHLSHYFLFYSIVEGHKIVIIPGKPEKAGNGVVVDYSQCKGYYRFNGEKIPFDPNGVWPMVPNPHMSKYEPGSRAYIYAKEFNHIYTKLLKSLHDVFNGNPDHINDAIGLMSSVELHLKRLVRTPVKSGGDPDIGPNAGPTFDFMP